MTQSFWAVYYFLCRALGEASKKIILMFLFPYKNVTSTLGEKLSVVLSPPDKSTQADKKNLRRRLDV